MLQHELAAQQAAGIVGYAAQPLFHGLGRFTGFGFLVTAAGLRGSNEIAFTFNQAVARLVGQTGNHGANATASRRIIPSYDGTNKPITIAGLT